MDPYHYVVPFHALQDLSCKAFKVKEKFVKGVSPCTGEKYTHRKVLVTATSQQLIEALRRITREEIFYVGDDFASSDDFKGVTFEASVVFDYQEALKEQSYLCDSIRRLLKIVEDEATIKELVSKYEKMLQEKEVSYRALWFLFKKGAKVLGKEGPGNEWPIGMEVTGVEYRRCMWLGETFVIKGLVTRSDGKGFYQDEHQVCCAEPQCFKQ